MSDRIAVFNDGRIEQVGTPARALRAAGDAVRRRLRRHLQPARRATVAQRLLGDAGTVHASGPEKIARCAARTRRPPTTATVRRAGRGRARWSTLGAATRSVVDLDAGGTAHRAAAEPARRSSTRLLDRRGEPVTLALAARPRRRSRARTTVRRRRRTAPPEETRMKKTMTSRRVGASLLALGAGRVRHQLGRRRRGGTGGRERAVHPARRTHEEVARATMEGAGQHPGLARVRRGRLERQDRRLGDAVREGDRLPGQRQVLRHLRRGGQPDEDRRVRRGVGLRRRLAAADRRAATSRRSTPTWCRTTPTSRRSSRTEPWNSVDGADVRHPARLGRQPADVQHRRVKPAPTAWGAVFDDASPYKGKITAYDSPIYIADAALYLMKTKPDLGIKNPYALDQKQFDAAVDLLKTAERRTSASTGRTTSRSMQAFKTGDSVLGTTWQVIANLAEADKVPVEAVLPDEGSTGWSDTWMVAAEGEAPELRLHVDGLHHQPRRRTPQVAEYFGEAPANPKACDLDRGQDASATTYHAADEAYADKIWYWTTPIEQCLDGRTDVTCTDYGDWTPGLDRRSRAEPWRPPRPGLRPAPAPRPPAGGLLLAPPLLWLGVVYLGALAALFVTAFWSAERLHRRGRADLDAGQLPGPVHRSTSTARHRCARIGDRGAGDGDRRAARVPDRVLHGQGRLAAGRSGCWWSRC